MDVTKIQELLPHRYPFLLVDKIIRFIPGELAVGVKNVTMNEPQFQGHFPQAPVMPGVLIIESMAQTAACMVVNTLGKESEGKLVYFMTIDEARFRKPVVPGDTMYIHVKKTQNRRNVWKFQGEAYVGETLCAEAVYSAMIMDR